MSDLIDRQYVIDALELGLENDYVDATKLLAYVKQLPSAESERVAKVETVEKPNMFKCSECGQYFHSTSWGSPVAYCPRCGCAYCPRCGARLEWDE